MGKYSGNLVRVYATADEQAGSFHPDPAHAVRNTPDEYGAVHQVPADTGVEYAGTEFPVDVSVGGGSVLGTPVRSHHGLAGRKMVYTDDQHRESIPVRHAEDGQRRYVAHTYQLPALQDRNSAYSDSWYHDNTWEAHPNNSGAVSVLRGNKTSIPQNNPDGVREGMIRGTWFEVARRLGRRRYRYDAQPLVERFTYQDGNVPAPAGADAMAAGSVLPSWLPSWMGTRIKDPALYRAPQAVDDSILAAPIPPENVTIGGGF